MESSRKALPKIMDSPNIAPLAEAAAAHSVKPATIRKWLQRGKLTHHGYDEQGRVLVDADELGRMVNSPTVRGESVITTQFDRFENPLVDVLDAAKVMGVKPATIRTWTRRGYTDRDGTEQRLYPCGMDENGRKLYRLLDVAKAERATRKRAGRQLPRPPVSDSDEIL